MPAELLKHYRMYMQVSHLHVCGIHVEVNQLALIMHRPASLRRSGDLKPRPLPDNVSPDQTALLHQLSRAQSKIKRWHVNYSYTSSFAITIILNSSVFRIEDQLLHHNEHLMWKFEIV